MYRLFNTCFPARNSIPRLTHYENVRWFRRPRKPFWLGVAPSKKFVVREPKKLPELENDELVRLQYVYNRQYASLRKFMSSSIIHKMFEKADNMAVEEAFTRSLIENDAWNAKSETLRREREIREAEEMENSLMQEAEQQMMEEEFRKKKIDAIIDSEIASSPNFVTEENLDEFIDKCLDNVVDYNYAIDLKGNIYKGDAVKPEGHLDAEKV